MKERLDVLLVQQGYATSRETLKKENCPDNVELFLESHTERGDHAKATRAKTSLAKKNRPTTPGRLSFSL